MEDSMRARILSASKQTIFHLDEEGINGNCFPACIAAITGKSINEIPEFQNMAPDKWGLAFIDYIHSIGWIFHGCPNFDELNESDWIEFPFLIVGGTSPRGILRGHAVIYHKGKPFWDPHPSGDFVTKEEEVYLLSPSKDVQ